MRVLKEPSRGELVTYEVVPTRSFVIAGAGSILMGLLPLIADGPVTFFRGLTSFGLVSLGALLVVLGRRRFRPRVCVDLDEGTVSGDGRAGPLEAAARIRLASGIALARAAEDPVYRAELELRDGAFLLMAESKDPGEVARAASRLSERLELPVSTGWGLPPGEAPWANAASGGKGRQVAESKSALILRYPFDRTVAWIVSGCAVLIGATTLIMVAAGVAGPYAEPGNSAVLVSYGLVIGMILLVLLVAAAAGSRHVRLVVQGPSLKMEYRTLGVPSGRIKVQRADIKAAFAVSPTKTYGATHLLLETAAGPVALPCPNDAELKRLRAWLETYVLSSP